MIPHIACGIWQIQRQQPTTSICLCRGREREVPVLAIQTLKKTRLHKCSSECAAEDVESSVHVVEV